MKKWIIVLLLLFFVIGFTGCGRDHASKEIENEYRHKILEALHDKYNKDFVIKGIATDRVMTDKSAASATVLTDEADPIEFWVQFTNESGLVVDSYPASHWCKDAQRDITPLVGEIFGYESVIQYYVFFNQTEDYYANFDEVKDMTYYELKMKYEDMLDETLYCDIFRDGGINLENEVLSVLEFNRRYVQKTVLKEVYVRIRIFDKKMIGTKKYEDVLNKKHPFLQDDEYYGEFYVTFIPGEEMSYEDIVNDIKEDNKVAPRLHYDFN